MNNAPPALPDLTPDWISALLQSHGVDARVASVASQPIGTGQVGATYRLTLDYAKRSANAPDTLVAKLPSNDPLSRATGKSHLTYIRESRFYQLFAGKKPLPVSDHLYISFDEETHDFALIMHDLPRHQAGNQLSFPSPVEVAHAIDAAATIHAAWWGDPALDTMDWLNGSRAAPPALDLEAIYAMLWPAFCDRYGNRVTPEMKHVGEAFVGRIGEWGAAERGPRCLTHNDFRPDNMLYDLSDQDQPIVIVDWQTVGVGSGAQDVAYYMGTALNPVVRKAEERELLARYTARLEEHGVPKPDVDGCWDAYRVASFSGFLMGATAAMVVVQTDRGDDMFLAMCERSAAMVRDHAEVALPS